MITPETLLNSFESYRMGDKKFCKLASFSDKDNNNKKHLGFWFEVVRNSNILVALIHFESYSRISSQIKFFKRKQLEDFLEEARQHISNDLGKMVCANYHIPKKNIVAKKS